MDVTDINSFSCLHKVDGMTFNKIFSEKNITDSLNLRPRDGDVVLVTYPKCGTTWTSSILGYLMHYGEYDGTMVMQHKYVPFVEMLGTATLPQPNGAYKTHLYLADKRWNSSAKYVWVLRNPKDACVSYFHHCKGMKLYGDGITLAQFVDIFTSDNCMYGCYFRHLQSFLKVKDEPNVILLKYEDMKRNPKQEISRLADFIGGVAKENAQNPKILDDIVDQTSVDTMRKKINPGVKEMSKKMMGFGDVEFVRKGIVGDWKNELDEEMEKKIDDWIDGIPGARKLMKELYGDLMY